MSTCDRTGGPSSGVVNGHSGASCAVARVMRFSNGGSTTEHTEPFLSVQRHTEVVRSMSYAVAPLAVVLCVAGCSSGGGKQSTLSTSSSSTTRASTTTTRAVTATTVAASACRTAPVSYGGPDGLSDQLVALFPTSFGGLADTDCLTRSGRLIVDIYVVGDPTRIRACVHPDSVSPYSRFWYVMGPAKHSYSAALALKTALDTERAQLIKVGADVHETGIRIAPGGPRVMVFLSPDTPDAQKLLRQRFGTDTMTIVNSTGLVPFPTLTPAKP